MTIFRHKNNKLYILEMVKRWGYTEKAFLVATPYLYKQEIKKPKIGDFVVVAEK